MESFRNGSGWHDSINPNRLCGHGKRHRKKEWQRDFSFAPGILLVRRNRQATITLQIPQHLTISALQDYPARKLPTKPYLFIDGFNKKALDTLPIMMVNGRLTKNSWEIVIPGSITTKGGAKLKVGNTVSLAACNCSKRKIRSSVRTIPYTAGRKTPAPKENRIHKIVGICQMPLFKQEESSPAFIVITTADASDNVDNLSIFAKLKKPSEVHSYAKSTAGNSSCILNNDESLWLGPLDNSTDRTINTVLYSVETIVILIITRFCTQSGPL